jgi:hypothetical protein
MLTFKTSLPIRVFYDRWKSSVFTFCLLLTGNEKRAEESTVKAFTEYVRRGGNLVVSEFPPSLLQIAFAATRDSFMPVPLEYRLKRLPYAIVQLPIYERAAFVIRQVLSLPEAVAAIALTISTENVRDLFTRALLRLQKLLPPDFFQRGGE